MTITSTPTEITPETALVAAATMVLGWGHSEDVFNTLNMGEGIVLAALFRTLDRGDVADHVLHEVWAGENEWDQDPQPWITIDGIRKSDREIRDEHLTDVFRFEPRHGAGYECDLCGAYEGEFVRRGDVTKCGAHVDEEMRQFIISAAKKATR